MKKILLILLLNTALTMQANGIVSLINDSDQGVSAKLIFYNKDNEQLLATTGVKSPCSMELNVSIPDKANSLLVIGSQTGEVHVKQNIDSSFSYIVTKSAEKAWTIKQN